MLTLSLSINTYFLQEIGYCYVTNGTHIPINAHLVSPLVGLQNLYLLMAAPIPEYGECIGN